MPRNKQETRCQVPGCRVNRDAEPGPRPVSAPGNNRNALKTGQCAHPLDQCELSHLARQLVDEPDLIPYHLGCAAQSVHSRARDPHRTLLAFRTTLAGLQPFVDQHQLATELHDLLRQFPPANREEVRQIVLAQLRPGSPEGELLTFRRLVALVDCFLRARRKDRHRSSPSEDVPFCF